MSNGKPDLVAVTAGGVRWHVRPECREQLLGPHGLRLDDWLYTGAARIVKNGPHRTVYRVNLPALSFYLKHSRLHDTRAWLRELVRPSKARMEHDRALAVAAGGVPTIRPLALGERCEKPGPDDSFLITQSLDETEPLSGFIETTLPRFEPLRQTQARQRLAVELGGLIARMHDAGIVHNDLHAGNLLIRLDADDRPHLYLIDLHAVHLRRPLSRRASRNNLIMLNRWFILRVSRSDRLRFWHAYYRARRSGDATTQASRNCASPSLPLSPRHLVTLSQSACDLEQRTWDSNLRFWQHRDRRCLVNNRYYRRIHAANVSGYAVTDVERDVLTPLLADPDAPFQRAGVTLLKDSRSSTVAEFDLLVNGVPRRVVYKRFRVTDPSGPWKSLLRPSPPLRSWVYGHGLRERCLLTARPLAVFQRRRNGLVYEGYLLTEKIPDAVTLQQFVTGLNVLDSAQRRARLRHGLDQVARLVRDLHRRQLSHRDLKAANILVTYSEPLTTQSSILVWLIDLVGVELYAKLAQPRKVQNLARLHASFCQDRILTRTDKLRFLRTYLQCGLFGRHDWKRWWREIEQATQAKVARNARNGRLLA